MDARLASMTGHKDEGMHLISVNDENKQHQS